MKKLIWIILAIVFIAGVSFANDETAVKEYTYTIINNATTPKTTLISTSIVRPNVDKITAYRVIPAVAGSNGELNIALYDSATVNANSELVGEDENSSTGNSAGERLFRPRKILNGIWVYQGAMSTAIISFVKE